jgi:hypothetical protein
MTVDTDQPRILEHTDEPELADRWWKPWLALALVLVLAAGLVAALLVVRGDTAPDPSPLERSTFTDSFGRQCTALRAGDAVALDCDYKPVESRLGSLLEGSQP